MSDSVDVVIIGAGPAGLSAASVLAAHHLTVQLIDEQVGPGGQIWRNTNPAHQWKQVHYSPASTVIDIDSQQLPLSITWLQRTGNDRVIRETQARALIIATGAMERPVLFPGMQLPGVMGIGALQSVFKQAQLVPRGPGVILAGQGPLLLLTLQQIMAQGASIDAVLDLSMPGAQRSAARHLPSALVADPALLFRGIRLLRSLSSSGIPVWKNVSALQAHGTNRIEQVVFTSDDSQQQLPARLLAIHDGVIPNTQMTRLLNLEHRWDDMQQCFSPVTQIDGRSSHPQIWIAGDGAGIVGVELALKRGQLSGLAIASALKAIATPSAQQAVQVRVKRLKRTINRRLPARRFIDTLYAPLPVNRLATSDTTICRCESVSLDTIRQAIAQGATGPNRVKTFTRCGMGACQGRQCGTTLTRIIAQETDQSLDTIGALRIRPPLKPTLIADYLRTDITNNQSEITDA